MGIYDIKNNTFLIRKDQKKENVFGRNLGGGGGGGGWWGEFYQTFLARADKNFPKTYFIFPVQYNATGKKNYRNEVLFCFVFKNMCIVYIKLASISYNSIKI